MLAVGGRHLDGYGMRENRRIEVVDTPHRVFPVHTYDCHEEVEAQFRVVAQSAGEALKLCVGNSNLQRVELFENSIGKQLGDFILYSGHIVGCFCYDNDGFMKVFTPILLSINGMLGEKLLLTLLTVDAAEEFFDLDFARELHDTVYHGLGTGRASGHIHVDGHDILDATGHVV